MKGRARRSAEDRAWAFLFACLFVGALAVTAFSTFAAWQVAARLLERIL